jgi:5-bromo-4-chloroindolyl phosphate hydrolysis protein
MLIFKDLLSYTSLVYICFLLSQILFFIPITMSIFNRIGEAMDGVLASSAVDNGF